MALIFPNNPENYKLFFKEFAKAHKNIRTNDSDRPNFAVVSIGSLVKGLTDNDISSFMEKLRTNKVLRTESEENCAMILVQMDNKTDSAQLRVNEHTAYGSFLIVTKPIGKSSDEKDKAIQVAYSTARSIMNGVIKFFKLNYTKGALNEIMDEQVYMPINGLVGWRFEFEYTIKDGVCWNAKDYEDLTITEL